MQEISKEIFKRNKNISNEKMESQRNSTLHPRSSEQGEEQC